MTLEYEYKGKTVTITVDYPYYTVVGDGLRVDSIVDVQYGEDINKAIDSTLRKYFSN